MSTELIAAAFEDGWAYIKESGKFYLVKPPYDLKIINEIDEQTMGIGVCHYGFSCDVSKNQFDDYEQLCGYLREMMVKKYKESGRTLPSQEIILRELRELLPEREKRRIDLNLME